MPLVFKRALVAASAGGAAEAPPPPGPVGHRPQRRDDPVLALPVERLLAAERHLEVADSGERHVALARLEIVAVDRQPGRSGESIGRAISGLLALPAQAASPPCPPEAPRNAAAAWARKGFADRCRPDRF